ncbi:MAG: Fe-S cluster assembly protein SufB, partial [Chloroflexi bacterium]|nr:Fe-S cluster assembly protein SufB [Chloroflexota bacterium]
MTQGITVSREKGIEDKSYKWGFVTDIETELAPKGLNEDIVRFISSVKKEPVWLTEWRLKALRYWSKLHASDGAPKWSKVEYPPIDFQDIYYYAAPKSKDDRPKNLADVDPEMIAAFEKLGVPLQEREKLAGVAVDAVFDSVSVATTFQATLEKLGIIFCSFSEAVHKHPDLVKKYLGSVVPATDNFYAALNSAVFSDGSFAYVPPGVRCPVELMTYFRINTEGSGQFERTLIIADKGAYVSYLEG